MASTNFINECKNRANANRLGKIIVDGIDTPITNSDNLQSFEIDSGCYVDGNIIGSVYAKCLKANFIADQNNLTDKSIQTQIGVKYADLSTEYINMGKYTIERPNNEITANYSQITAYDDLYTKLDSKYVCNIDYSSGDKTVSDLYIDVCNQLGLTPKTTEFINSTIPITDNPFTNGESNRTVLQTICKISCSFIDNDTNEIDLCWLSSSAEPDYIFQKNDYSSVEGGQVVCGPINCLIIKNSQIDDENVTIKDGESISENGEHSIIISEDYILHNAELREQAVTAIWNRVKGMKYVDCKLTTYYGKPFLKLGSYIRVYTSDTKYFDTYVLKHNFKYDGAFTSVIESPALTKQEIKTKQDISLGQSLKNTQIDVDKQNQKITALVKKTDDLTTKTSQLELDVDKIQGEVSEIADITTNFEGVGTINILNVADNSEPVYLKIKPTIKNLSLLYPHNNLFPSDNLFPIDRYLVFKNGDYETSYMLPTDLWYYSSEIYDEFILDSKENKCCVIRRVGVNEDGTTYPLMTMIEENFVYPQIPLTEGNYEIKLEGHPTAYLYAKLIAKNIYTNQLVTQVEYKSQVKVTSKEIQTLVSEKVGNNEVVSKINQTAEAVKIKANKIETDGVINAINNNTTTTIDGDKITTGSITANQIKSGAITAEKVSSDIITTNNFSAQKINADKITAGTLSAASILLNNVSLTPTSSKISGWTAGQNYLYNGGLDGKNGARLFTDGRLYMKNNYGWINSGSKGTFVLGNGTYKAILGDAFDFGTDDDITGDSSSTVALRARYGNIRIASNVGSNGIIMSTGTGGVSVNGNTVHSGSSKLMKKNIKLLNQHQLNDIYLAVKRMPLYRYDYKKAFYNGEKNNYGFIIEDIEETVLKDVIHISENLNGYKQFNPTDLPKLNLIIIKELMKKIEMLEDKIKEMERDK